MQLEQNARPMVYPYSVIPGGAMDRGELMDEVAQDEVVAAHYDNFQVSRTEVVRLQQDLWAHVSYRLRNKIYWTAKKINLKRGEVLLTDGREFARTRCGNRLSIEPQDPVSDEEPTPDLFETPLVPDEAPSKLEIVGVILPLARPQEFAAYATAQPHFDWPYKPPRRFPPPPIFYLPPPQNPTVVPEPGTLSLLGSGLAIGLLLWRKRRRR